MEMEQEPHNGRSVTTGLVEGATVPLCTSWWWKDTYSDVSVSPFSPLLHILCLITKGYKSALCFNNESK